MTASDGHVSRVANHVGVSPCSHGLPARDSAASDHICPGGALSSGCLRIAGASVCQEYTPTAADCQSLILWRRRGVTGRRLFILLGADRASPGLTERLGPSAVPSELSSGTLPQIVVKGFWRRGSVRVRSPTCLDARCLGKGQQGPAAGPVAPGGYRRAPGKVSRSYQPIAKPATSDGPSVSQRGCLSRESRSLHSA